MGSSESKPAASPSPHVWKAPGPTGVSLNMAEQLQSSTETDTSRAQILELQIQARVAEELRRLQAQEAARMKETQEKISTPSDQDDAEREGARSRHAVSKEVEALRARLEGRRKVREPPAAVDEARSDVIRCLHEHDRRPLDCWREVERFKDEVRKLEKTWVDKVVS